MSLIASDTAERSVFNAIFSALDRSSRDVIGPVSPRLLVIPIRNAAGEVAGGFWGVTLFQWLEIEMLFVPEDMRGQGIGSALMTTAEAEARERGCLGIRVDTFSVRAAAFYRKLGFSLFGVLDGCPPGHQRMFFHKRLA